MTETKKTAPKKTATKKTSTKTQSSSKTTSASKPAAPKKKQYDLNTLIPCKSVRQNQLYYRSPSGVDYIWMGVGDIRELPYQEILAMRSSRSKFLYEPWLIIDDDDLLKEKEFANDFGEMYALYKEFGSSEEFFEQPLDVIEEKLHKFPSGLKDLVLFSASESIKDGSLDRVSVVSVIDKVFGTNLKMLML